jgi:hypothetical protein
LNICGRSLRDSRWMEKFKLIFDGILYLLSMRFRKLKEVLLLGSTKLNCFLVVN